MRQAPWADTSVSGQLRRIPSVKTGLLDQSSRKDNSTVKGAVSRNSAKLGNNKMHVKLSET